MTACALPFNTCALPSRSAGPSRPLLFDNLHLRPNGGADTVSIPHSQRVEVVRGAAWGFAQDSCSDVAAARGPGPSADVCRRMRARPQRRCLPPHAGSAPAQIFAAACGTGAERRYLPLHAGPAPAQMFAASCGPSPRADVCRYMRDRFQRRCLPPHAGPAQRRCLPPHAGSAPAQMFAATCGTGSRRRAATERPAWTWRRAERTQSPRRAADVEELAADGLGQQCVVSKKAPRTARTF